MKIYELSPISDTKQGLIKYIIFGGLSALRLLIETAKHTELHI